MFLQRRYEIDATETRRVIADHGWARIVTMGAEGLRATYAFCLLEESAADEIVVAGHFGRGDPQCADIEAGLDALLIFEGPHGFISASWYAPDLVDLPSTWNHISVHLAGTPEAVEGDERFDIVSRTLLRNESRLGDAGWRLEGDERLALAQRLVPHTVAFRMRATRVEAKAKLSQDKPLALRERVVERLGEPGPLHHPELAELMRRLSFLNDDT